jgi:hypothetical protein
MARGDSFRVFTVSGLPLSPIHVALEAPGLLVFKPSLWVVRLPAVISGIAAILLLYLLSLRIYDRTTALIASSLLAVLPLAIIFSRVSYESSHAPLLGTVLLYLAHRLKAVTLAVVLAIGYFIHPTNIFVLPILLAVILVRTCEEYPFERARSMKAFVLRSAPLCAVVAALGLMTILRSDTQRLNRAFDTGLWGRHDFLEFGAMYERLLMGVGSYSAPLRSRLFWSVLAALLGLGLWRLISIRQWGRVLLVGGTVASVLSLFVAGGTNIIQPGMTRYGLFLVIPTVLSTSLLTRALLVGPSTPWRAWALKAQCAGLLAFGWALLWFFDLEHVNRWSYMSPEHRCLDKSPLTLRSHTKPPLERAYSVIERDLKASGQAGPSLVITTDWCQYGPLEWLATSHEGLRVMEFHSLSASPEGRLAALRNCLKEGGYAAIFPFTDFDKLVSLALPPRALYRWDIPLDRTYSLTIVRAKRDDELRGQAALASADGHNVSIDHGVK